MAASRYAVIVDGAVQNCIMYCPECNWPVPDGTTMVSSDLAQIGDTWDGASFSYIDSESGLPVVRA